MSLPFSNLVGFPEEIQYINTVILMMILLGSYPPYSYSTKGLFIDNNPIVAGIV